MKYILIFLGFITISLIIILPFCGVFYGLYLCYMNDFLYGILFVVLSLFILWLVKPISILMDDDYKIF